MAASKSQACLEVRQIKKSFRDQTVLREVSFSLGEGEILGLIGPNGAGKPLSSTSSAAGSGPTPAAWSSAAGRPPPGPRTAWAGRAWPGLSNPPKFFRT
jgi:hypothetical protein